MSNEIVAVKALASLSDQVYGDLLSPSVKRVGLSLETLIKVAVTPVSVLDWGFEQTRDWLKEKIAERFSGPASEFLVQPKTNIVSSALQHIAISNDTPELRGLYGELLLKAMDSRTTDLIHPAYFHIVEQLVSQEALVLVGLHDLNRKTLFTATYDDRVSPGAEDYSIQQQFSDFCFDVLQSTAEKSSVWMTNLCRLGILELQKRGEAVFKPEDFSLDGYSYPHVKNFKHASLLFTEFGQDFVIACAP